MNPKKIVSILTSVATVALTTAGAFMPLTAGAAFTSAPAFLNEYTSNGGFNAVGPFNAASANFFYVSGTAAGTSQFMADGTFLSNVSSSGGLARDAAGNVWISDGVLALKYAAEPSGFDTPSGLISLTHSCPATGGESCSVGPTKNIAIATVGGVETLYSEFKVFCSGPSAACNFIYVEAYRLSDGASLGQIVVNGGFSAASQVAPGPMAAINGNVYAAIKLGVNSSLKNITGGGFSGQMNGGGTSAPPNSIAADSAGQIWATWAGDNNVYVFPAPTAAFSNLSPLFSMTTFIGGPGVFTSPQALSFNPNESRLYVTQAGSTLVFGVAPTPTPGAFKDILTFSLQTVGNGPATFDPIGPGAVLKVFNIADTAFTAAYGSTFASWKTKLDLIWNGSTGLISSCSTDGDGACTANKAAPGNYLTVGRYVDTADSNTVYVSKNELTTDFNVDMEAFADLKIIKKYKDGALDSYGPGGQVKVVTGVPLASSGSGNTIALAFLAVAAGFGIGIYLKGRHPKA